MAVTRVGWKERNASPSTPTPAIEPRIELGTLIVTSKQPFPLFIMLTRITRATFLAKRAYATIATPNTLILLEHRDNAIVPATLNAITAAKQLGGNLTGLIVGEQDHVQGVLDKAKRSVIDFLS